MNNFKFTVPVILGIITIAELIANRSMIGSIILWLCYGAYKMLWEE